MIKFALFTQISTRQCCHFVFINIQGECGGNYMFIYPHTYTYIVSHNRNKLVNTARTNCVVRSRRLCRKRNYSIIDYWVWSCGILGICVCLQKAVGPFAQLHTHITIQYYAQATTVHKSGNGYGELTFQLLLNFTSKVNFWESRVYY